MSSTITAMFDNRAEAMAAVQKIESLGIVRSQIKIFPENETTTYNRDQTVAYDHTKDEGGFWESLSNFFMPEEDRYAYAQGMSQGSTTLVVTSDETYRGRVEDILEENGSIDLDQRVEGWKSQGWSSLPVTSSDATKTSGNSAAYAASARDARGAESIPLVKETLKVGKRVVDQGRVRVRSYVVETPVEEQVSLRDETVHIERRPVDRAATAADGALFTERSIEATERDEQAVVSKEARVTEELVLKKDVEQRSETVKDTVRRTEVEVDDTRVDASRTDKSGIKRP